MELTENKHLSAFTLFTLFYRANFSFGQAAPLELNVVLRERLYNEGLQTLYPSRTGLITGVIKVKRTRLAGHLARMGETSNL
jgi:hypothetical protein